MLFKEMFMNPEFWGIVGFMVTVTVSIFVANAMSEEDA